MKVKCFFVCAVAFFSTFKFRISGNDGKKVMKKKKEQDIIMIMIKYG